MKPIVQSPYLKGLQAANQVLAQPKGSVARISNLLYTKRGALKTCDGSQIINWQGALQLSGGRVESLNLIEPIGVSRYFLALINNFGQLTTPVGLAVTDGGAGGTLPAATYYYVVTAVTASGGETVASAEVSIVNPGGHKNQLNWTGVTNAYAYNVYRGTSAGNEFLLVGAGLPVGPSAYLDDGTATVGTSFALLASPTGAVESTYHFTEPAQPPFNPGGTVFYTTFSFTTVAPNPVVVGQSFSIAGVTPSSFNGLGYVCTSRSGNTVYMTTSVPGVNQVGGGGNLVIGGGTGVSPPTINTTGQCALVKMPNLGNYPINYSTANIVALFPSSSLPLVGGFPAGTGVPTLPGLATPNGGIVGATGPLPQILQFNNQAIIILGNGTAPQLFTDPTTVTPISNTFIPAYPAWSPGILYAVNTIIVPANSPWAPNVAYPSQSAVVPDTPNGFYYIASKGGTSGSTEPSFPATIGDTVSDGTVTWTCAGSVDFVYKAIQAGVSGGASGTSSIGVVPAFPQTPGDTIKDGGVVWQNAGTVVDSAPSPPGAAFAIVYAGCLWVGNTYPSDHSDGIDGPSSIRMSNVNAPTSWNPINQAFLDKDDGTEIQGGAAFTITAQGIPPEGSLVIFKDFATYQIQGIFGASNFAIQRVRTDMGCTAGRSVQFVPGFGIVRKCHLGFAVFDGVNDRVISEEIRPYLFQSNDSDTSDILAIDSNYDYDSWGFQTADPPMYCCACPLPGSNGALTRLFCYDLVLKNWTVVDLPFAISCAVQVRAEGTQPISMFGGFSDGTLQRWQANDVNWYTGASSSKVLWSFRTQDIASQIGDQRIYVRRLAITGANTNSTDVIVSLPEIDGVTDTAWASRPLDTGDFEVFAPINRKGLRAHSTISGSGVVEIRSDSWHIEPIAVGVPKVIA